MRKLPAVKNGPDFRSINTSVMPLDYNRRQNLMGSVETMNDDDNYRPFSHTTHTKDSAEEMNKENYRPANYAKALEYKCERSYLKKQEGRFVILLLARKNWTSSATPNNSSTSDWGRTSTWNFSAG